MKNKYTTQKGFVAFVIVVFASLLSVSAELKVNFSQICSQQDVDSTWIEIGPNNVSGRVRALLWDNKNDSVIYAGGVAGGLFKSTNQGINWSRVEGEIGTMPISCIYQDLDGNIYVGTGEGFSNINNLKSGFTNQDNISYTIGNGIYKASVGSSSFVHLEETKVENRLNPSELWAYVNKIAGRGNLLYAATNSGIYYSENAGESWTQTSITNVVQDIEITSDGATIYFAEKTSASASSFRLYKADAAILDLTAIEEITIVGVNFGRIEIALTKEPNELYFIGASDGLNGIEGIYFSNNRGVIEPTKIGYNSNAYKDSRYSLCLATNPNNPDIIYAGAYSLQSGTRYPVNDYSWDGLASSTVSSSSSRTSSTYLHENIHNLAFHPNPKTADDSAAFFVATDGGVSFYHSYQDKGTGATVKGFEVRIKNLNISQISSIGHTNDGAVVGGLYNDGSFYIQKGEDFINTTADLVYWTRTSNATPVGGPVFGSIFQRSSPDARCPIFFSQTNANLARATGSYYVVDDQYWIYGDGVYTDIETKSNVPVSLMWETMNDQQIKDSTLCHLYTGMRIYKLNASMEEMFLKTGDTIRAGDTIVVEDAKKMDYPFQYAFSEDFYFAKDTSISVKSPLQNRYFIVMGRSHIVVSNQMIDLSAEVIDWKYLYEGNTTDTTVALAISKDGNHLFFATKTGGISNVYRISDVLNFEINDTVNKTPLSASLIGTFSRAINSLYVDPNDSQRLLITYGNILNNGTANVLYSENALATTPTFVEKFSENNSLPVYSGIIEMNNSNIAYIGTEFGVYKTEDLESLTPTWERIGSAIPVRRIFQQQQSVPTVIAINGKDTSIYTGTPNIGGIYFATYGGGIYADIKTHTKSTDNKVVVHLATEDLLIKTQKGQLNLTIKPNPIKDVSSLQFNLPKSSNVVLKIYGIGGNLQYQKNLGYKSSGMHEIFVNADNLKKGIAIVQLITEYDSKTINAIVK